MERSSSTSASSGAAARFGLLAGTALLAITLLLDPPDTMPRTAWFATGVMLLMVCWWVTEAIPISATALIPLLAFPLLGVMSMAETAVPYADPVIYLFIGGFMIALSFERWQLHARLALAVASRLGTRPAALLGAFLLCAIMLSMWISNTATTLMLIPIALGVVRSVYPQGEGQRAFASALLLAVAYGATIGGIGTPVGTPTNLIAIAWLERQGVPVSFLSWMLVTVPIILLLGPIAWWVLSRGLPSTPGMHEAASQSLAESRAALGPLSAAEKRLLAIFGLVASGWVLRDWLATLPGLSRLTDTGIAVAGALALFVVPAGIRDRPRQALADWSLAEKLPWGVALLYGGGLSIAAAMEASGLSAWLGDLLGFLGGWPIMLVLLVLVAVTVFASELMSNTATLTSLLPLVGAVVLAMGGDAREIIVPVAIAASFGFMLPVSTPPNSIAYGSGFVTQREMLDAGWRLNLIAIVITTVAGLLLIRFIH